MPTATYSHYDDPDIVSILDPLDQFYGFRIVDKQEKEVKYTIDRKPVYFGHSNNWAIRVHSRGLNSLIGKPDTDNLTEIIYVNANCMNRYRFKQQHINFHRQQKQIKKSTK